MNGGVLRHHPLIGRLIAFVDSAGMYGLPLFFFLSSFLITTLLLLEKDKTGQIHLRSFYIRRILRIWPLYFGFLTLAFILGQFWKPAHFSAHALIALFLLSGNWYVISAGYLTDVVTFLWSISVEEQFYLLWPTFVRKLTAQGIERFCIGLFILSLCSTGLLAATHSSQLNIWFNSAAQMLFFAGGGILALHVGLARQEKSTWKTIGALIAGCIFWLAADAFKGDGPSSGQIPALFTVASYLFTCLGCASFLWGFLHMPTKWQHPKLIYLGRISYGLYVFQGLSLVACGSFLEPHLRGGLWLPIALLVIILVATLSYEFYEKPFLRLKKHFEFVHSRPA